MQAQKRRFRALQVVAVLSLCWGVPAAAQIEAGEAWLWQRVTEMADNLPQVDRYPKDSAQSTAGGAWKTAGAGDWTSGFFPGMLWLAAARHEPGAPFASQAAARTEALLALAGTGAGGHDVGFIYHSAAVRGWQVTGDDRYRRAVVDAVAPFMSHWLPETGAFWSFGFSSRGWRSQQNTIIDSAMNMEGVFWAARHGGPLEAAPRALSHLRRLMREHLRADGSTVQVVDYFEKAPWVDATGAAVAPGARRGAYGWQGHSAETTWSRGQAWALHGLAAGYRMTREPDLWAGAERAAGYFLDHLPPDGVPWWDFDAPALVGTWPLVKDTSAAATAAAGFYDMARLAGQAPLRRRYFEAAESLLRALSARHLASQLPPGRSLAGVLADGAYTVSRANSTAYDQSLIWGDYYYAVALERRRSVLAPDTRLGDDPLLGDFAAWRAGDPARWEIVRDGGAPAVWLRPGHPAADQPADWQLAWGARAEGDFVLEVTARRDEDPALGGDFAPVLAFGGEPGGTHAYAVLGADPAATGFGLRGPAGDTWLGGGLAAVLPDWRAADVRLVRQGGRVELWAGDTLAAAAEAPALAVGSWIGLGGRRTAAFFRAPRLTAAAAPLPDNPWRAWQQAEFGAAAGSFLAAPDYDRDGDGLPNLAEALLGRAPAVPEAAGAVRPVVLQFVAGTYRARFRLRDWPGVAAWLEVSGDGRAWRSAGATPVLADGGFTTWEAPLPEGPAALVRLGLRLTD